MLRLLNTFALDTAEELTFFGSVVVLPDEEDYPAELRGQPALVVTAVHTGDEETVRRDLAPLRSPLPRPWTR